MTARAIVPLLLYVLTHAQLNGLPHSDRPGDRKVIHKVITRCILYFFSHKAAWSNDVFDDWAVLFTVMGSLPTGHGFKFGPIVGKLLYELSQGEVPSYDLSPFRIRRFETHSKSAL